MRAPGTPGQPGAGNTQGLGLSPLTAAAGELPAPGPGRDRPSLGAQAAMPLCCVLRPGFFPSTLMRNGRSKGVVGQDVPGWVQGKLFMLKWGKLAEALAQILLRCVRVADGRGRQGRPRRSAQTETRKGVNLTSSRFTDLFCRLYSLSPLFFRPSPWSVGTLSLPAPGPAPRHPPINPTPSPSARVAGDPPRSHLGGPPALVSLGVAELGRCPRTAELRGFLRLPPFLCVWRSAVNHPTTSKYFWKSGNRVVRSAGPGKPGYNPPPAAANLCVTQNSIISNE